MADVEGMTESERLTAHRLYAELMKVLNGVKPDAPTDDKFKVVFTTLGPVVSSVILHYFPAKEHAHKFVDAFAKASHQIVEEKGMP